MWYVMVDTLLQRVDINCVVRNGRYFIARGGHKLCGT